MFARMTMAIAVSVLLMAPATYGDENPYLQPDETWISISGTVAAPGEDSFRLDYGDGMITVEMDDWDRYGEAKALLDGDRVTVYGRIDRGLYENTTIEANSVYIESLNTHFYANSADEEGDSEAMFWNVPVTTIVTSAVNLRGTVSSVEPKEQIFTLDTGDLALTVDTENLDYNPLDEFGYHRIDVGDWVSVTGYMTTSFFEGHEFQAESVTTLVDASDS